MAKEKLPAIHLYPGDWLRDPISGCSLAAQGLWLRMMFVAHDAQNYGEIFDRSLLHARTSIARRCGCSVPEFDDLFAELLEAGVPRINGDIVLSQRMVRDASVRAERTKAGRKGGKQTAKQNRSKAAASTAAKQQQIAEIEDEVESDIENEFFEEFWKAFPSGRKKSKARARAAFDKAVKKVPAATIIAAAVEYAASGEGLGSFVKMPETWLNGECWSDDRDAWNQRGSPAGGKPLFNHTPQTTETNPHVQI